MVPSEPSRNELMIGAANRFLASVKLKPLSAEALDRVHTHVSAFIDDLILESVRVMKRQGGTEVSRQYVDAAIENIRSRRKYFFPSLCKVAGGVILGGCLTVAAEAILKGLSLSPMKTASLVIAGILGAFMLSYFDWRSA